MNEHIQQYYLDQASGIFHGPMIQNGHGLKGGRLGTLLKQFMTWITPLAKKHFLPTFKEGAKAVGTTFVNSLADFARDTINGKDIKDAATERYHEVVDTLKQKAENKLEGKGIKRKMTTINKGKKNKNFIILKKKDKLKDIFDI